MPVSIVFIASAEFTTLGKYTTTFVCPEKLDRFWKKLKSYHSEDEIISYKYYTVNRHKATPRPADLHASIMWCPWCAGEREFIEDNKRGVHACEICEVSTQEFHVVKNNVLLQRHQK